MGKYRAGEAHSTADCALDTSVNLENVTGFVREDPGLPLVQRRKCMRGEVRSLFKCTQLIMGGSK